MGSLHSLTGSGPCDRRRRDHSIYNRLSQSAETTGIVTHADWSRQARTCDGAGAVLWREEVRAPLHSGVRNAAGGSFVPVPVESGQTVRVVEPMRPNAHFGARLG